MLFYEIYLTHMFRKKKRNEQKPYLSWTQRSLIIDVYFILYVHNSCR